MHLSIHIRNVLLCVLAGLMFSACIYDRYDGPDDGGGMQLVVRVSTLGADASQRQPRAVETVNSLRIIVIDKNSRRLDLNEKVDLSQSYAAKNFSYVFIRSLTGSGAKQVYLVANEESVGEVSFVEGAAAIPEKVPTTGLTALLDYFKADPEDASEADYTGGTFADVLNRVYFRNAFPIEDGEVALPYSACYEWDEPELYDKDTPVKIEKQMYLVPVAAKFDFVFTNFRKEAVCIDDVVVSAFNSHNYLNARLAESEKKRTKPDGTQDVWWIDWLEACAEGSQTAGEPDEKDKTGGYNGMWGWIRDYKMPVADEPMAKLSLREAEDDAVETDWTVGPLINIKNPPALIKGPYYVPESFNHPDSYDGAAGDLRQYYALTLKVHDEGSEEVHELGPYEIDTLGALFRDTHIIIYVEFYESEAEIYVEIAPWGKSIVKGYVQQDDEY